MGVFGALRSPRFFRAFLGRSPAESAVESATGASTASSPGAAIVDAAICARADFAPSVMLCVTGGATGAALPFPFPLPPR